MTQHWISNWTDHQSSVTTRQRPRFTSETSILGFHFPPSPADEDEMNHITVTAHGADAADAMHPYILHPVYIPYIRCRTAQKQKRMLATKVGKKNDFSEFRTSFNFVRSSGDDSQTGSQAMSWPKSRGKWMTNKHLDYVDKHLDWTLNKHTSRRLSYNFGRIVGRGCFKFWERH